MSAVPLLTAKIAKMIDATSCCNCAAQISDSLADSEVEAIQAIAEERVRCVPVMTEEAWLAEFDRHTFSKTRDSATNHAMWMGYLALARHLRLVGGEG